MKLNVAAVQSRTHEGAPARRISAEEQLRRSVMSCLLWEDEFYEDGKSIADRISEYAARCSPEFVSSLAIEAKNSGLRHAPLWLCMDLVRRGGKLAGDTLANVIRRADELAEVVAMYWKGGRRPLSAQMKRGLRDAFPKFNAYSLAKYNRDGAVKLRDVLFLVHPKPKDAEQAEAWKKLASNTLESPDTWEVALSSGKDKRETFERLLREDKLGDLAFLRNLRGMVQAGVSVDLLRGQFDRPFKGILPFQFIAAARACPALEPQIDRAMLAAMVEMERLRGRTVLLVDVSGSMTDMLSGRGEMSRMDAACGIAILLAGICEDLSVATFSNATVTVPTRQGMALRDAIVSSQQHGGTALGAAVKERNTEDRLIVITDEQSRDPVPNPKGLGYMINVASAKHGIGYGPWVHIDGFSSGVVQYIAQHEKTLEKRKLGG